MTIDIFISYAREDARQYKQIFQVERLLSSLGYAVWRDDKLPAGEAYPYELARAIEAARLVIVFWGKASVLSQWVYEEAERGKRAQKLLPITLGDVTVPMGFGLLQTIDLSSWLGDEPEPPFQQLIHAVAVRLGEPPDRKQAQELLRGFQEYVLHEHGYDLDAAINVSPSDAVDDFLDVEAAQAFADEEDRDLQDPRQAALWTLVYDVAPHMYVDIPDEVELPTINTVGDLLEFLAHVGSRRRRLSPEESRTKLADMLSGIIKPPDNWKGG